MDYIYSRSVDVAILKEFFPFLGGLKSYALVPLFDRLISGFIECEKNIVGSCMVRRSNGHFCEITTRRFSVAIKLDFIPYPELGGQDTAKAVEFSSNTNGVPDAFELLLQRYIQNFDDQNIEIFACKIGKAMDGSMIDDEMRELYFQTCE